MPPSRRGSGGRHSGSRGRPRSQQWRRPGLSDSPLPPRKSTGSTRPQVCGTTVRASTSRRQSRAGPAGQMRAERAGYVEGSTAGGYAAEDDRIRIFLNRRTPASGFVRRSPYRSRKWRSGHFCGDHTCCDAVPFSAPLRMLHMTLSGIRLADRRDPPASWHRAVAGRVCRPRSALVTRKRGRLCRLDNRHFDDSLSVQIDISSLTKQPGQSGVLHSLEGRLRVAPESGESPQPGRIRDAKINIGSSRFLVSLPARSASVVEVPLHPE